MAASTDTAALHITLSIEPRRWQDLVRECVEDPTADEAYQDSPYLGDGTDTRMAAEFAEKLRLLRDRISRMDAAAELGRLSAARRGGESPAVTKP